MIIYDTKNTATRIMLISSHIRGLMPDTQLQQTTIAFTFLRRIDCLIGQYAKNTSEFYSKNKEHFSDERLDANLREISGGYPFYNYSGYTFEGILLSENTIDVVLNSYFQGFSKNILEILDGLNFKQNLAILKRQSRYLVELFQCFAEMDLSSSVMDNEEFVKLMTLIVSSNTNENCTPLYISNLICECLFSEDIRKNKEDIISIYDPVCGTGSSLAIAGEKAKTSAVSIANVCLYGQEVSIFPTAVAKALILLTGNENSQVQYGNTLLDDMFPDNRFQYILAELPFGLPWRTIKDRIEKESLDINGRFNIGLPSITDSQFLFIEHIISKMDACGSRAAFITTASVLYGGGASSGESRLRRWLFEHDMVETIIALPEGTLPRTKACIYLWILSNKKNDIQRGKVRLINLSNLKEKDTLSTVSLYKQYANSPLSQIVKNEQFGYYEVDLLENGKKKETVTISLDTDIEQFIKKERQPYTKGKITVDYSSVEKGYSVQFDIFFKTEEANIASLKDESETLLSVIDSIVSLKNDIEQITLHEEDNQISKSWRELPLRSAADIVYGINRPPIPDVKGLPILSVPYLIGADNDDNLYAVTSRSKCSSDQDTIIVMKKNKDAKPGEIFRGVNGILSPFLAAIKCSDETIITPQYLYYLLKGYEKTLMSMAKGITIKTLTTRSILDLKCLIPPIEEQLRIATYLDDVVGKIDKAILALNSSNNVFVTYRQTLIENIVKGLWRIP